MDGSEEIYITSRDLANFGSQLAATIVSSVMMKVEERFREHSSVPAEGTIMANTWTPGTGTNQPEDGTAIVLYNKTASVFTDQGDAPTTVRMRIANPHPGDSFGPDNDERVHIHMTETGPVAVPYGQVDGMPGPPAGERWIGDKKRIRLYTRTGFQAILDDTAKTLVLSTPGGLSLILNDNTGKIEIGKDGLAQADSLMTQQDSQTLANAIIASVQAAFTTFAAHVQSGSGSPPPTVGSVTATGSSVSESEE